MLGATSTDEEADAVPGEPETRSGKPIWIASILTTSILSALLLVASVVIWPIFMQMFADMGGMLPALTSGTVALPLWAHVTVILGLGPGLLLVIRRFTAGRDSAWLRAPGAILLVWGVVLLGAAYMPMFRTIEKPVIYLYPRSEQAVRVELDLSGWVTSSIPSIEPLSGSWTVRARPDGTLTSSDGTEYPYIYWEGALPVAADMEHGFVVPRGEVEPFLQRVLEQQGLNAKERADFIDYWKSRMTARPFVLVHFEGPAYESKARLRTTPAADTTIRVFMVFRPLEQAAVVEPQVLPPVPERRGFVVVEWGGTELPGK